MSNFFLFSTKVLLLVFSDLVQKSYILIKFSDLVQKSKSKCGFMRRAALLLSRVFSLKVATFCSNPFEHVSFVRFQEESLYMVLLENKNHECLLAFY